MRAPESAQAVAERLAGIGRPLDGGVYVVTGGRRGIGAEIVKGIAYAGGTVLFSYADESPGKDKRTKEVLDTVQLLGGRAIGIRADATVMADRVNFLDKAVELARQLDPRNPTIKGAVWNHAGGLEEGRPSDWADIVNNQSTLELDRRLSLVQGPDGKRIFVTSVWAHRFGEVKQLPYYRPVAKSKKRAEMNLRAESSAGFLVGHIITGTGAYALLERAFPERMAVLRQTAEGGQFPDALDMGVAAVRMLISGFEEGQTEFVGGRNAEPKNPKENEAFKLNREQLRVKFPMYGDSKLLLDEFDSPEDSYEGPGKEEGVARYTVRPSDTEGHFEGVGYEDLHIYRGVDRIEQGAQAIGAAFLSMEDSSDFLPVFRGIEGPVQFTGLVVPGEETIVQAAIRSMNAKDGIKGDFDMYVGRELVTSARGVTLGLIPGLANAKRMINYQLSRRQR